MIKLLKQNGQLMLAYQPGSFNSGEWIDTKLARDGEVTLRRTFTFTSADLVSQPLRDPVEDEDTEEKERVFKLGVVDGDYYRINKAVLGLKHDLLLGKTMKLDAHVFIANRDISIFRRIDELVDEPIVVGEENEDAILLADFEILQQTFPTSTELTHYARSRISRVLKDYFGTLSDAESKLNSYLTKKERLVATSRSEILGNFELQKFEYIQSELSGMLQAADSYLERDWQKKILELLLFVFPKYVAVLEEVVVNDYYSHPGKTLKVRIDLMLVDAGGNVDVIEVKRPDADAVITRHKYRKKHHTPRAELTSAVMQAEKYLFHLNKLGRDGEREIYEKRKSELPAGIKLQITNPKALILLGRDNDFTGEQRFDFEIIRRKYANMVDIMTYDDLLRRLENITAMLRRNVPQGKRR